MTVTSGSKKLLVSVRNVEEARAALAGGADIIDVKEPAHGSLGRAKVQMISTISSTLAVERSSIAVSAALGEVSDASPAEEFRLSESVRYAKLGLSLLSGDEQWVERWVTLRETYDCLRATNLEWVAVIYADEVAAQSPPAIEIITAAAKTGCVGVLVDTWSKSDGTLLDHVLTSELTDWANRVHLADMFFAVAGKLSLNDLAQLSAVNMDVIAVRSAVCEKQNRQAAVEAKLVAEFRKAVNQMPSPLTSIQPQAASLTER